ncbi:MAG TPA: hypothetical protein VF774_25395 [Pseudoduganella sp.]|jgi:hypothetical protein
MLYAAIAIIIAGISAALSPLLREWYEQRERKRKEEERDDRR